LFSDVLILAGGIGERLWPASTVQWPKQFMRPFGGKSFLQETILRATMLDVSGRIIIVTQDKWVDEVVRETRDLLEDAATKGKRIPPEKIVVIGEPCGKNTAPAAALVCRYLLDSRRNDPYAETNVLALPSDHIITGMESFIRDVNTAAACSRQNNIVVFGVPSRSPETGFGYMEAEKDHSVDKIVGIAHFKEKPNEETAKEYVRLGNYYWNAGLYGFRAAVFLEELKAYAPEVFRSLDIDMSELIWDDSDGIAVVRGAAFEAAYRDTPAVSIDYAVSEKSARVVMIKAAFDWDDAGTWDSLAKYEEAAAGLAAEVASARNFVYSDIPVALCGVKDLCVIIQNGRALVMKKGFGNEVKKVTEKEG
jgi:mannose-1-phosphate guanylyltransferase/mannose-6-phosphate isomerase